MQIRPTVESRRSLSFALDHLGHTFEVGGELAPADSIYRMGFRIDSLVFAQNLGDRAAAVRALAHDFNDLDRVLRRRQTADTAGRDSATAVRALRAWEEVHRLDVAATVWFWRRNAEIRRDLASRDSLGSALGNLSWSELLTDRPEEAVLLAAEGDSVSPRQTFILPNLFNALLLSGRDEEAARFFQLHSGEKVEATPVPFPCAVQRDILELQKRGVALDRHVQVVERLVTPFAAACQKPSSPGTR
jgi:hypothetical protein